MTTRKDSEKGRRDLPVGLPVPAIEAPASPRVGAYGGTHVTLSPPDPAADAGELYRCSHGAPERERLWTYMGYGPFADVDAMKQWLVECRASSDPLFLVVRDRRSARPVGMASFLRITPRMRTIELGHIWYAPEAQHTEANTETVYLMLQEAFDRLKCRRVEWKCDSLNVRSRAAALRLGFRFEGIFRQHMIVKGRNRDTAWFAMLDADWPEVARNLRTWLDADDRTRPSLAELNERVAQRPPDSSGERT